MTTKFSEECMVCGHNLLHLLQGQQAKCYYCGKTETSYFICSEGHFVCNNCHAADALAILERYCLSTKSTDPLEMLEALMNHPGVAMHGPEHHAIVPAVLVTAYRNLTGKLSDKEVLEAISRGCKIPGGYCGIYGACGAGVGTGVAVSVITGATPLKAGPRALSNLMTAEALYKIAGHGGVRCCKSSSRTAVNCAVEFFRSNLDCDFNVQLIDKCHYVNRNRQCNTKDCSFFEGKGMDEQQ